MDKKTMLKVFGEAFLRSFVVLMAIVIIGFAAFFVIKLNTDKKVKENTTTEAVVTTEEITTEATTEEITTTEEPTTEEITTEEPTTEVMEIPSTDKKIIVLNSTGVAGLAKRWANKLTGSGFSSVVTGNYTAGAESKTKIYVAQEGMGNDLISYFSDAELIVGALDSGNFSPVSGVSADGVEIYIVIGDEDTTVQ